MNLSFRNYFLELRKIKSIPNLAKIPDSVPNVFINDDARSDLYKGLIIFTIFFPYIPGLIRSSDTQPFFILIISCWIVESLLIRKPFGDIFRINNRIVFYFIWILALLFLSIFVNKFLGEPVRLTKVVAFYQFILAVLFGFANQMDFESKTFKKVLQCYLIFTILFFLLGGFVEDLLIGSRNVDTEFLLSTGRGAKTLSPEPSQFATQIFNILVLYILLFTNNERRFENIFYIIAGFCLLASFSGYGLFIFGALFFVWKPRLSIILLIVVIALSPIVINYLRIASSARFIRIAIYLLENGFSSLTTSGIGAGRVNSFLSGVESFLNNFLWGDGFSVSLTGGLITLPSALGIFGFLFLLIIARSIVRIRRIPFNYRLFILFWFFVNLISGTIAIPIIGIIIGFILRPDLDKIHEKFISS